MLAMTTENLLLLKLLVALVRPDLAPSEIFVGVNGGVYAPTGEDGTIRLDTAELIEGARKLAMEVKKLRKDFNAEANYQDWRSTKNDMD